MVSRVLSDTGRKSLIYRRRKEALKAEEEALHMSMHPDMRQVMGTKKLLLFREMLADAGVQDSHLFEDMAHGFRITGELQPSGQFPAKCKVAALSVADLRKTASWAKHLVETTCRKASKDPKVAKAV